MKHVMQTNFIRKSLLFFKPTLLQIEKERKEKSPTIHKPCPAPLELTPDMRSMPHPEDSEMWVPASGESRM